jgi:hypothetical protein
VLLIILARKDKTVGLQTTPEWFYLSTIAFFNLVMLFTSPFMGYYFDKGKDYQILLIAISGLVCFQFVFS